MLSREAPVDEAALPAGPQTVSEDTENFVVVSARVVDLDGQPVAGITPIVVATPNAFNEPIASGPTSNEHGESRFRFEPSGTMYIRAYDPGQVYSPNNYITVLPAQGGSIPEAQLVVAEAATLQAQLFRSDGEPIANENAGIMMLHPVEGPWWPSETDTDAEGVAVFRPVPPGSYVIRLKTVSTNLTEIPETLLPPATVTDLGVVTLN